jgi:methyl acetate hydrolase
VQAARAPWYHNSMPEFSRRELGGLAAAMAASHGLNAAPSLDPALRAAVERHRIPAAVAAVATSSQTLYTGAFGKRDSAAREPLSANAIFRIASMTKAITTASALQQVEKGKLALDEPVSKYLPELGGLQVLEGFDGAMGAPRLRPAVQPVTLRRLLTHTSGFAYDTWDPDLFRLAARGPLPRVTPLVSEPGTRWEYSSSIDWAGRIVEAVSGQTLEAYFQQHILQPLGMADTSFILPPGKFDRLMGSFQRHPDGTLMENPRLMPDAPRAFNGGGGLYSTAADYVRFMQMILRRGRAADGTQILQAATVESMTTNQVGTLSAGKLKSVVPSRSSDADFHPGFTDGFTFGFLYNHQAYEGGRSAGSLAWAGIQNTFFWIDPKRDLCAVLLMQFMPFCDARAVALLRDFERAVYASLA